MHYYTKMQTAISKVSLRDTGLVLLPFAILFGLTKAQQLPFSELAMYSNVHNALNLLSFKLHNFCNELVIFIHSFIYIYLFIYCAAFVEGVGSELRLRGGDGNCQGRLEVFDNVTNEWHQVCNGNFTVENALEACSRIQGCNETAANVTDIVE